MRALWPTLALIACGGDPILERAKALAAEDNAEGSAPAATDGGADETEAPTPGISDETITPGTPEEPEPAPPGTVSEGVVPGTPEDPTPAPEGAAAGADTGAAAITPGVPEEPDPAPEGAPGGGDSGGIAVTPGVPEEPEPGSPGSPGGKEHDGKKEILEGPQATLKGRISMDESIQGKVYIDVFDGDQRNTAGRRPSLVRVVQLDHAGPFEIQVPLSAKRVWLSAYADTSKDKRPTKGEPTGWYPGNPVFLSTPPAQIVIELVADSKAVGLGLDFGQ